MSLSRDPKPANIFVSIEKLKGNVHSLLTITMQLLDKTVNNAFCLSMAGMKMNSLLKAHLSSSHYKSEFSRTLVKHNSL